MNPLIIVGGGVAFLLLMMQRNGQTSAEDAARRAAAQRAAEQEASGHDGGSAEEWIQKGGQYIGLAATAVGIGAKVAGWLGLTGTATAATGATVGTAAAESAAIAAAEAAALSAAEASAIVGAEAAAIATTEIGVGTGSVLAGAGTETVFIATETAAVAGAETGAVAGTAIAETAFIGTVASGTLVLAGVGAVVIAIMVSEMLEQQRVMRKRMRRLGDAHDFTSRIMQPFIDAKTYDDVRAGFMQWSGSDGIQVGNALAMYARHRHQNDFLPWNLTWAPKYGTIADTLAKLGYPGQSLITVRDVNSVYEASADDRIPAWESMMSYLDQVFMKFEPDYAHILSAQRQPPIMVYQVVKEPEIISGVGATIIMRMKGLPADYEGPLYRAISMMYSTATVDEVVAHATYLLSVGSYGGGPIDLGSASP